MTDRILAFFYRLFELPRAVKYAIQLATDAVLLVVCFATAMALRLDGFAFASNAAIWIAPLVTTPVSLVLFAKLELYLSFVRYISSRALKAIVGGGLGSALVLAVTAQIFELPVPRSVPFIYMLLVVFGVGGVRFALRALYRRGQLRLKTSVLIYGAGDAGRQLAASLHHSPEYVVVALIDDEPALQGREIAGHRVHGPDDVESLVENFGVEMILLAIPSASNARRKAIIDRIDLPQVKVRTIPGMADIVLGNASISELREVAIEDLLGRDPVPPRAELLDANIAGKVVLVTGAGGSIGSELCRQILRQGPAVMLLFDAAEFNLYMIDQEITRTAARHGSTTRIVSLLGSVQDRERIETVMRTWGVHTVYHAAAYKHVPLVELNVVEGIRNNVEGTLCLARTAAAAGVEAFILISSDKAVRPTNVMGASKRMAELICQALARAGGRTIFSMVRFGNVLGSSGSVIPLFRRQIEAGGPITVTHPEITRYFMTIPEAAQLVIQAGAMARGGDVFVLDMGEPVRIVDLAKRMVRLHGLIAAVGGGERGTGRSIDIVFTQLRPGEKLYEELLIGNDAAPTDHPRIMTAHEAALDWRDLEPLLDRLRSACLANDVTTVRDVLRTAPTGYDPGSEIDDLIWTATPSESRPVAP